MCILFVHTNPHPQPGGYRLVIASNRDEYYKRPAKGAYHCSETNIIGGRDMEPGREGGMWLGMALKGTPELCFAALLNVTGAEKKEGAMGRGGIVYEYLAGQASTTNYVEQLKAPKVFVGFNVVTVEIAPGEATVYHHSNSPEATLEYSGHQVLGFGNSTPASPLIKVVNGKEIFEKIIKRNLDKEELTGELLRLLKNEDNHLPDSELQKRAPNAYEMLSSIFVQIASAGYGTRTHSIILVDYEGNVEFTEHTMKEPIDINHPEWEVTVIKSHL